MYWPPEAILDACELGFFVMTSLSEEDETQGDGAGEDAGGDTGENAADDTGDDASPFRERPDVTTEQALAVLTSGEISLVGRMPWSSNATFLVDVKAQGELDFPVQAVYKPVRGERRLWDFPPGLHRRERACFVLSEALGWGLVPPTIIRDGPLGEGSLQLFVLADFEHHYFTIRQIDSLDLPLRRLCAFDFVSNATDRKSGHVLLPMDPEFIYPEASDAAADAAAEPVAEFSSDAEPDIDSQRVTIKSKSLEEKSLEERHPDPQNIFAIDNGLSFHSDFKLRTVLWDFSGEPLPQCVMSDLQGFLSRPVSDELAEVLTDAELDAAIERAELLLESAVFPTDPSGQRWPWPVV